MRKRNAGHLKPWFPTWPRGGPSKYSLEAYEAKLRRARRGRRDRSMFTFGVFHRRDRSFIGEANLGHIFYAPGSELEIEFPYEVPLEPVETVPGLAFNPPPAEEGA